MPSSRLPAIAFLAFAATAASAQSTTQPAPNKNAPAHDSRDQVPAISPGHVVIKAPNTLAQNDSVCYALRTYQFTPTEPATGATTYKDQTTCVPAHSASAMIVVAKPK